MHDLLADPTVAEAISVMSSQSLTAIWETFYSTVLSTFFAYVIGLPLGVMLVVGDKNGIHPLPKLLMQVVNVIINLLRAVPFLILMIMVIPVSRAIIGTSVGTPAIIPPLVVAAFPFVARLVETSLREVDQGVIEAAQSMGASTWQLIYKVIIPESMPSLISNATTALTTILGYGAMAGILGGGGLGMIAINYGYYRYKYLIMVIAVILLVIMVVIFQSVGTHLALKSDKRLTKNIKRRRKQ
ncbi:MAG: ABC transporter permease [Firmicutes bacterium]|nr:ABC transporter permease [Bacillota bacterium]